MSSINRTQYKIDIEGLASSLEIIGPAASLEITASGKCRLNDEWLTVDEIAQRLDDAVEKYYEQDE